jgi:hypothetical protein
MRYANECETPAGEAPTQPHAQSSDDVTIQKGANVITCGIAVSDVTIAIRRGQRPKLWRTLESCYSMRKFPDLFLSAGIQTGVRIHPEGKSCHASVMQATKRKGGTAPTHS